MIEKKTGYQGNDIKIEEIVEDQKACAKLAAANKKAKFWTYHPSNKKCFIKTSKAGKKPAKTSVSGNRECGEAEEEAEDAADGEKAEDDAAEEEKAEDDVAEEEKAEDDAAEEEKAEDDAGEEEKAEDDAADGEDKEELPEGNSWDLINNSSIQLLSTVDCHI